MLTTFHVFSNAGRRPLLNKDEVKKVVSFKDFKIENSYMSHTFYA